MNTMEITKIVGGLCGSLLVFLLVANASSAIFDTRSDVVAFEIDIPEPAAAEDEADEDAPGIEELFETADASAGASVWRRCSACHQVEQPNNGVGPHLVGILGRDIASVEGFNYSSALAGIDGDWDLAALDGFIENPRGWAPGTTMAFAGISSAQDRANLIAYMASYGD